MGQVLEFLGLPFIQQRLEIERGMLSRQRREYSEPELRPVFREQTPTGDLPPGNPFERILLLNPTRTLTNIAVLEHARGASAEAVRDLFRQAAVIWEPVIAAMDFMPRVREGIEKHQWDAKAHLGSNRGTITKVNGGYQYRYEAIPEPLWIPVHQALACAAISGDRELAQRMARAYKLKPASEIAPGALAESREHILRHLLAGDEEQTQEAAKGLKPGYNADFPPDLVEFPLGVVRNDPELLLKGLKTINTRFKNKWDERTWRKRYEKIKSGEIRLPRGEPMPTWEDMLEEVRGQLFTLHWILSPYALAFLNVARWRGMESPFDKPKAFSEWIPQSLCGG